MRRRGLRGSFPAVGEGIIDRLPGAAMALVGARVVEANAAARPLLEGLDLEAVPGLASALADRSTSRGELSYGGVLYDWSLGAPGADGVRFLLLHDMTPRKRRADLWEPYRLLSETLHDIVLFVARDGSIIEANEAAALAYGRKRAELMRMNVRDLRAPSTRDEVPSQMRRAFDEGVIFETRHLRADGTTFPVEVSSRAAPVGGDRLLLSIVRDLTDRNAMQARVLQADRMAAVGTLAAGVAHEINNPLAYAITNLEVLARLLARIRNDPANADFDTAEQMLEVAREGADRVRMIVRDLRTFSRADDGQRGPVDVRVVLDSCINMASAEWRHRARVVRDYGEVPTVDASESRLAQVFLNLVVNAAQSFVEGDPQRNEVRVRTATGADGQIVVEIADNGPGIEPAMRARVFEPFVTSKAQGTGLGLFISRDLVHAMGGTLELTSEVGQGARMIVTLPVPDAHASVPPASPRAVDPPVSRRRLLVVDDEDSIGSSIRRALEGEMNVVTATSAREALARLAEDPAFDVVLCDVVMPELDGLALQEAVAGRDADLARRFVFMTGGTLAGETRAALAARRGRLLEKPFTVDELRRALR